MIVELCVLVGSEVYDIRLNAVWALMVSGCPCACVHHMSLMYVHIMTGLANISHVVMQNMLS